MDTNALNTYLNNYFDKLNKEPSLSKEDLEEREERKRYYQQYSSDDISKFTEDDLYEYLSKLWAMKLWGNKHYIISKFIQDNGLDFLRNNLCDLLYSNDNIQFRWDRFINNVKGFGPAMMSELLCYMYPDECMIWNGTAKKAYQNLSIPTPKYNYQLTGENYCELTKYAIEIKNIISNDFNKNEDLLFVDYFFWDQLRTDIREKSNPGKKENTVSNKSYHDEIISYIKNIGQLLGYDADATCKISDSGKKADAAWEFNVGNFGKIRYVFEVQDKGSIDSLLISLENASQDISTQAVVAVSDAEQIEKIKQHSKNIADKFNGKMRYWDITEIEQVHQQLENSINTINKALGTKDFYNYP